MNKSNSVPNHSFKKIVVIALLSMASMGTTLSLQAEGTTKNSTQSVSPPQSSIVALVNINKANAEDLADALTGVGLAKANAIVAWRQKNGQFKHIDDLLKVKGIGKKTLAANTGRIGL